MKKKSTIAMSPRGKGYVSSETQEAMYRDDPYQFYSDLDDNDDPAEIERILAAQKLPPSDEPIKIKRPAVPQEEMNLVYAEFDSHREEILGPQSSTTGQEKKD